MRDNLPTEFPKPPELHPLRSIQARFWQIVGLVLITGGLLVMGWGGWVFYQQQTELLNPPAPIVEAAAIEDIDTPTTFIEPSPSIEMANDPIETDDTPATVSATQPVDSIETPPLENVAEIKFETPTPEKAIPEKDTDTIDESTPEVIETTEGIPSLEDNPLVVVEENPAPPATLPADQTANAAMSPPTRIVAGSINLDAPVVETGWKQIIQDGVTTNVWIVADYAAGWHQNSMLPGQDGNIVLSGHHNIKGEVFRYIVDLEVGDVISVYVGNERYDYVVNDKFIVKDKGEPESVRRANAKWIGPFNEERLTLVTCWPYNNNTHRIIVIAKPV